MALVYKRLSQHYTSGSGHVNGDDDFNPTWKRDMPASDSQPARTKTGQQKMAVVLSLLDNSFKPVDGEHAIVVRQQSMDVDDHLPPPPLTTLRQESLENGREKFPGLRYKGAKKGRTKKSGTGETYKRKRRRPAGSKCAKRKREQRRLLADSSSGTSSEGMKDKDDNFESEDNYEQAVTRQVSDDDGGRKKYARVKSAAWERAVKVQENLPAEGPSLVKLMLHSHVVNGFWLSLQAIFCRKHLPKKDVKIVLEDEEGQTCDTNYLAYKMGLSGGWRGFAEQHDLKVGDALVFQLVRPTTFKVYILRENKFTTTDGALGLLSLDPSMENITSKKEEKESSDEGTKSKEEPEVVARVSSKPSTNGGSGIRSPGPDTGGFVAMKRLVNFKVVVGDGSVVGRRVLPDHLRKTYYELCDARKAYLHRHLMKQISPVLAAGMIVETANIAEGIMASCPDSLEDLLSWKKTLESFEALGMDVAFMIKRVDDLLGLLSAPSSSMEEPEGYEGLKLERARAAKKVRDLQLRLSVLKDTLREMDEEMEQMVEENTRKKKDQAVRELATAPW